MTQLVLKEAVADGVVLLTLNRPEARNAFDQALLQGFSEALADVAHDNAVHAVVVTGGPEAFCAGGDLREMAATTPVGLWASPRHQYWRTIHTFPKPMIAAVNGLAFGGGCELALASDIIVAGENARFALPEIKLGFVPGRGGTQRLPTIVNKFAAMHMILTGDAIDAETALRLGLVWEVVPTGDTIVRGISIAEKISSRPPVAVQIAKELVAAAAAPSLQSGMANERHCYEFLCGTEDAKEGMTAFIEKRPPEYRGR